MQRLGKMIHKIVPWYVTIISFGLTIYVLLLSSRDGFESVEICVGIVMLISSGLLSYSYFKIYKIFGRLCDDE